MTHNHSQDMILLFAAGTHLAHESGSRLDQTSLVLVTSDFIGAGAELGLLTTMYAVLIHSLDLD